MEVRRSGNKFGDHARKEHEGHPLVSTVEAFQQAIAREYFDGRFDGQGLVGGGALWKVLKVETLCEEP